MNDKKEKKGKEITEDLIKQQIVRDVLDKLVIPIGQAFILSGFGAAIGSVIDGLMKNNGDFIYTKMGALVPSFGYLIYSFQHEKGWKPGRLKSSGIFNYNKSIPMVEPKTNITVVSQDRSRGDYYNIKGFSDNELKKIGFYLIYFKGTVSHNFLDIKYQILKRSEVKKLQVALLSQKLLVMNNYRLPKQGMSLTKEGEDLFKGLAKMYVPSPLESKNLRDFIRKNDLR